MRTIMFGVAAFLASASASFAAEYEFVIPVSLNAMPPEINQGEINCSITAPTATGSRESIGGNLTRFAISSGGYNGEVRVGVNRTALAGSRTPTHWNCFLRVYGTVGGVRAEFWSYDDPTTGAYGLKSPPGTSPRLEIPAAAGAPKVVSVNGAY